MVAPYKIIKRPLLTEKSSLLREMDSPKFTFIVDRTANKHQIQEAAEEIFDLRGKIRSIRTMNIRGKPKGRLMRSNRGRTPHYKKAIITLRKGETIPIFDSI